MLSTLRIAALPLIVAVAACTQASEAPVEEPTAEVPTEPEPAEEKPEPETPPEEPELVRTPSLEGAKVFFKTPADGDTVKSPVKLEFGLETMTVAKAGDPTEGSGHHHLIVDAPLPPMDAPIPASDNYIHFGDGSTSKELELEPGEHTLQLLLGDHRHIPHDPPVQSEVITITVKKAKPKKKKKK